MTITGTRLLLSTGTKVSAVELAAELAGEVQHYLAVRLLAGPVVALPGAPHRRLLLLADSAEEAPQGSIGRLHGRGAITHRCGALVPLPPSQLACGAATWTVPPALAEPWLPPFTAIAAAVRTLTSAIEGHSAHQARLGLRPMCVCGWQLITLVVFTQLLIITYGELEGRRRSKTNRHGGRDHQTDGPVEPTLSTTAPPPTHPSPTPAAAAPATDAEPKGHQG